MQCCMHSPRPRGHTAPARGTPACLALTHPPTPRLRTPIPQHAPHDGAHARRGLRGCVQGRVPLCQPVPHQRVKHPRRGQITAPAAAAIAAAGAPGRFDARGARCGAGGPPLPRRLPALTKAASCVPAEPVPAASPAGHTTTPAVIHQCGLATTSATAILQAGHIPRTCNPTSWPPPPPQQLCALAWRTTAHAAARLRDCPCPPRRDEPPHGQPPYPHAGIVPPLERVPVLSAA